MKTVGQILKTERKKQQKTIAQIHQKTKIPSQTLLALEADDFISLPPAPFVKGFIKNYAQILGLNSNQLLAVFRRDWQASKKGEIIPKGLTQPLRTNFIWTPQTAFILGLSLIITLFAGYLGLQLIRYFQPPKITLYQPAEGQHLKEERVRVVGKTSKEASVYLNDNLLETDDRGNFSYQLKLFPGENIMVITAVDRRGKKSSLSRRVIVDKKN